MAKNWKDEVKRLEQDWMVLKDQYAELAIALGFEVDAWFGDPLASHEEIVKRAKVMRRVYNGPCKETF